MNSLGGLVNATSLTYGPQVLQLGPKPSRAARDQAYYLYFLEVKAGSNLPSHLGLHFEEVEEGMMGAKLAK